MGKLLAVAVAAAIVLNVGYVALCTDAMTRWEVERVAKSQITKATGVEPVRVTARNNQEISLNGDGYTVSYWVGGVKHAKKCLCVQRNGEWKVLIP